MKVLSIDGGGIRGLIPALVLAEIERRTGRRTATLFDAIAGASTGGILACGLARPGADGAPAFSAEELAGIYVEEGPKIFRRSLVKRIFSVGGWVDERYEDDGLNAALAEYLGDTRLREALVDVLITAYDIEGRFAFFFRSARARQDPAWDFAMADAARATSAAPSYFEPFEVTDAAGARTYPLIDGGIFATNPAMCAYADVLAAGLRDEPAILASLGTGSLTRPYSYEEARWWGQLEWARPVIDIALDGTAQTVDFQLEALLGTRYLRLQTELTPASEPLDDASPENLARLTRLAEDLIASRSADIDRLCAVLTA